MDTAAAPSPVSPFRTADRQTRCHPLQLESKEIERGVIIKKIQIYKAPTEQYVTFRIPAITATAKGTVCAFCSAREDFGDWAKIDLALRRSHDGGDSWEPPRVIATDERTVDSSIPIYDRETGAIHFLYQTDYARCFYLRSEDEGETFSEPVEITATFEAFRDEYPWRVFAPGPGHALQMDTGRLVIPVWLSTGTSGEFGPEYRGHRPVGNLSHIQR